MKTILKILEQLGASEKIENRCVFYIVSANKSTLKKLQNRMLKYNKHITDDQGRTLRIQKNRFQDLKIYFRYFEELENYINRG